MLDIGSRLDILSRTLAHKRTHKRGIQSFPPIAGGTVTCNNANLCDYLNTFLSVATSTILTELVSGSDIRNELDWVWGVLGGPDSNDPIGYPLAGSVHDDLVAISAHIGVPYSDLLNVFDLLHNIMDEATTASSNSAAAVDNTQTIMAALPYPNDQADDVHADINRAIASVLLGITLSDLIKAAVGTIEDPIGTLLQTIELAFPNHTGDVTTINYNTQLIDNGQPPPITALTQGSALTLGDGVDVEIPVGTYAYSFTFDVPDYWGTRGFFTQDKTPAIAVLDWLRDAYSFDNPKYIRRTAWLAFPLHPAANRFTVDLTPGVTGTYTPWTL